MTTAAAPLRSVAAPEFNLALTLASGQVFHWTSRGAGYAGVMGETPVHVEQRGDRLFTTGDPELVARYFALDHPLSEVYRTFPTDPAMDAALAFCRGIRIIRQPAWECLATFITSSMKQVAHISQISHTLRTRHGRRLAPGGPFAYPAPERLASLREEDLRACALGYRARNLLKTARMVASGEVDLDAIRSMPDEQAREELRRLAGVGEKVANCVLLFAYERVRAFPIDVWIERVLRENYFGGKRKVTAGRLRDFSGKYFGEFGGYAQQYLFHHARSTRRRKS
ncbi:MAG: DNA glycosylase [Chthoniobacteraceae bacterium]|jgi:N-glycosylase/DNA lyase